MIPHTYFFSDRIGRYIILNVIDICKVEIIEAPTPSGWRRNLDA
jgi:hypothetical protein